jgi:hypothetical protein
MVVLRVVDISRLSGIIKSSKTTMAVLPLTSCAPEGGWPFQEKRRA